MLSFTRYVLVQRYFVFSHAFAIEFILSISLLLLHFNISSAMNSVSDTCKLSYFMIIELLVCNSTAISVIYRSRRALLGPIKLLLKYLFFVKISSKICKKKIFVLLQKKISIPSSLVPNIEFEKSINKNFVFSTKKKVIKFINSSINR